VKLRASYRLRLHNCRGRCRATDDKARSSLREMLTANHDLVSASGPELRDQAKQFLRPIRARVRRISD